MFIRIVGHVGPSLPISIRNARERLNAHVGKGDPIWDTQFTTKFSKKPSEDAPMVVPMGAARVIHEFESRVAELAWLEETQHQELATTLAEMRANSISAIALDATDEPDDSADIAEAHLGIVPLSPDPLFIGAMKRRIEHERFLWGCSGVHKTMWVVTKDGQIGVGYDGPDSKNAEKRLAHMRAHKARWIEKHGTMPTAEELNEGAAHAQWYGKAVLASMTKDEYSAHHESKREAYRDDPEKAREAFHADPLGPRPAWSDYDTEDPIIGNEERDQYKADVADWEFANNKIGYAGPSGLLGLDDDNDDE